MTVGFYEGVMMYFISPRARGVAWHLPGWRLNLSIKLNESLPINIYLDIVNW